MLHGILITAIVLVSAIADPARAADETHERVVFSRQIRPLLSDHCFACHGPDEAVREADLRLDRRDDAFRSINGVTVVEPGHPDRSELFRRIASDDPDTMMPPPDSGVKPLSDQEITLIQRWIAEGADWQEHWSLVSPSDVRIPEFAARNGNPASRDLSNPIDRFVVERLNSEGLTLSSEASRESLIRRVSFALTGLPPTVAEVDAFLSDPADNDAAFANVVDRLLASPHYGERMALTWLEASRYADTDGYQNDGPRTMWPWRDWVINAYNSNMPFDQFTIEQLAGDLLPNATRDQMIATGFNRNHRYNSEAGLVLEEFLLENAVDRVDTTSTVWLGLTVGCARCHDHKYDPISQREYYQLIAFFNNVSESGRAVKFGNSEPWVKAPTPQQEQRLATLTAKHLAAHDALLAAQEEIDAAIAEWVSRSRPDDSGDVARSETGSLEETRSLVNKPVISRGLTQYFPLDELTDETKIETGAPTFLKGIYGNAAAFGGDGIMSLGKVGDVACQTRSSIGFWLNLSDAEDGVIISRQQENPKRPGVCVELKDGHLQYFIITRWVAGVGAVETVATLTPDEWIHVTVTNDGSQSAGGMKIFLNGQPAATRVLYNTNSNTGGTADSSVLRIGGGVIGRKLRGRVDDLRFYNRTLWDDEIALLAVRENVSELTGVIPDERDSNGASVPRPSASGQSDPTGQSAPRERRSPDSLTKPQRNMLRAWFLEHIATDEFRDLAEAEFNARMAIRRLEDSIDTTMVMDDLSDPRPTHVRIRGAYDKPGDEVARAVPAAFPPMSADAPPDRLGFARWLVSGEHPLTARVAVNRYWQMHFGRGLVATPEDWGAQGEPPSHPELLDCLANKFVAGGWDVKALQRQIVMSRTWRQQSLASPPLLKRDPQNVLLARGPRLRLSAQAIRDQSLAVSGLLVTTIGGPSVSPYQPAGLWDELSNMKYQQSKGDDLYRRSLYTIWKRTLAPPTMAVLDSGDRESCKVRPVRTNTPLQALTTLNETGFVEAARQMGYRMLTEGGVTPREQLRFAFRLLLSRQPTDDELAVLETSLNRYRTYYSGHQDAAKKLLSVGESQVPNDLDHAELAARTAIANTLLNLDEALTPE